MNCGIVLTGRPTDPLVTATLARLPGVFTFVPLSRADTASGRSAATQLHHDGDVLGLPLNPTSSVPPSSCTPTPVVPLGGEAGMAAAARLVQAGQSFRYTRVAGAGHTPPNRIQPHPPQPRDVSGPLPAGLVVFGIATCPHTIAAVGLLTENGLPFLYLDVTGNKAAYDRGLGDTRLSGPYRFTDALPPEQSDGSTIHRTVPAVFLNDQLIGGRHELTEAWGDTSTREVIENETGAAASRVVYFDLDRRREQEEVIAKAVASGKVVRVVKLTL